MAENLRVIHYIDGTPINDGSTFTYYPLDVAMDGSDSTKYYFYQNNDTSKAIPYGCLYNWFAAVNGNSGSDSNPSGIQGACPLGWHIPSIIEWETLKNYVGENSRNKLIQGGSSGFNAVYTGTRNDLENGFQGFGEGCSFISTNVETDGYITLFVLHVDNDEAFTGSHRKTTGYSVRCIKDSISTYINNDKIEITDLIYPNPCNDYFNINAEGNNINKISIYSLDGKQIKTIQLHGNNSIPVSDIENGLYTIKIYINNNIYTEKLLIK